MDTSAPGVPTSPLVATSFSPQNMAPGPPHPFAIAPAARTTGLSTPGAHIGLHSSSGYGGSSYNHPYTTSTASPSNASASIQEARSHDTPDPSILSPAQLHTSSSNAQKRAYRQRRKDPSCDACRERKVKCDATETTACSECSSRNHKCQFTKETNRRMSSIKQVQDLQTRIAELAEENEFLKKRITEQNAREYQPGPSYSQRHEAKSVASGALQKQPLPALKNFDHVRRSIQDHSQGIFELPSQFHHPPSQLNGASPTPDIPNREEYAYLSRSYLDSIHTHVPLLHWPTFQSEVDHIYTTRSFQGKSREWVALFFAVLACGALHNPGGPSHGSKRGFALYEISAQALVPLPPDATITHAAAMFLLSIFALETELKAAGQMWFAVAVRHAQRLRLYSESDCHIMEREMRRRLWWSIYALDRIHSLTLNLPMLINDDDCEIALPSSLDDRYIQQRGYTRQNHDQPPFAGFLALIQTTRLYSHLQKVLKTAPVAPQNLQYIEDMFHATWALLVEPYQRNSDSPLEQAALLPLFAFQTGRFFLYRRNISTLCRTGERSEALHRCTMVGQETAKYISRSLHSAADPERWRIKAAQQLSFGMVALHLWRCILVLSFSADYEAALMCLHLAAAIGDSSQVNVACGRNLAFFLDRLIDRVRSGTGTRHHLEYDEEMLAYVSGDIQGAGDHAWIWSTSTSDHGVSSPLSPASATSSTYSQTQSHYHSHQPTPRTSLDRERDETSMQSQASNASLALRPTPPSPIQASAERSWDGWPGLERRLRQLLEEHRAQLAQPTHYYPPPHNPMKRVHLAPEVASPARSSSVVHGQQRTEVKKEDAKDPSKARNRISIANII